MLKQARWIYALEAAHKDHFIARAAPLHWQTVRFVTNSLEDFNILKAFWILLFTASPLWHQSGHFKFTRRQFWRNGIYVQNGVGTNWPVCGRPEASSCDRLRFSYRTVLSIWSIFMLFLNQYLTNLFLEMQWCQWRGAYRLNFSTLQLQASSHIGFTWRTNEKVKDHQVGKRRHVVFHSFLFSYKNKSEKLDVRFYSPLRATPLQIHQQVKLRLDEGHLSGSDIKFYHRIPVCTLTTPS